MTSGESVTKFKLDGATIKGLLDELNAHLKLAGCEPEESGFSLAPAIRYSHGATGAENARVVSREWLFFIAFAVEGISEGYYVHLGAILSRSKSDMGGLMESPAGRCKMTFTLANNVSLYEEWGLAKMNSAENAYAVAREAQRFLTAATWN